MEQEPFDKTQLTEGLKLLIKLRPDVGVSNFRIEGHADLSDRGDIDAIVGTFPNQDSLVTINSVNIPLLTIQSRILALKVPKDTLALGTKNNKGVRKRTEERALRINLPSCALVFGRNATSEKPVVVLYALAGISPQTTLKEIQEMVRRDHTRLMS